MQRRHGAHARGSPRRAHELHGMAGCGARRGAHLFPQCAMSQFSCAAARGTASARSSDAATPTRPARRAAAWYRWPAIPGAAAAWVETR